MTTNEEIIEKRLAIKAIMYICPECDARIIFRNNVDKHEHKTYRVAEFSEEELKTMLSEAHAAGRAEVQSGKLTEVGQSLYDRRKDIEAYTVKQLFAELDDLHIVENWSTQNGKGIPLLLKQIGAYKAVKKQYGVD